jgi:hypothetical protein
MKSAEEVWADFDELMDVHSVCSEVNLENHTALVKKVSIACTMQVIHTLHQIKYKGESIEDNLDYWNGLYYQLLKL